MRQESRPVIRHLTEQVSTTKYERNRLQCGAIGMTVQGIVCMIRTDSWRAVLLGWAPVFEGHQLTSKIMCHVTFSEGWLRFQTPPKLRRIYVHAPYIPRRFHKHPTFLELEYGYSHEESWRSCGAEGVEAQYWYNFSCYCTLLPKGLILQILFFPFQYSFF